MKIRPIEINEQDINELKTICSKTFEDTFLPFNPALTIQKYISTKFNEEQLKTELKNPYSKFYFAEIDERNVGYLKINFGSAQTEKNYKESMEIERIYVLSEYHGKGVGQSLLDYSIKIAKNNNVKYIWLGVWEKNKRAVRFYEKNGFVKFDDHIFMMGDKKQSDIIMKLELQYSISDR
jgi:ribosomal protein S18 acetylase RimI-like enzyme